VISQGSDRDPEMAAIKQPRYSSYREKR